MRGFSSASELDPTYHFFKHYLTFTTRNKQRCQSLPWRYPFSPDNSLSHAGRTSRKINTPPNILHNTNNYPGSLSQHARNAKTSGPSSEYWYPRTTNTLPITKTGMYGMITKRWDAITKRWDAITQKIEGLKLASLDCQHSTLEGSKINLKLHSFHTQYYKY